MTILGAGQEPGHIAQSLDHVNEALDAIEQSRSKTYVAERLFDGLNKLQTEWMINQTDQELHEVRAFIGMIIDGIPSNVRNELFQRQELKALIDLQPPIMNHYTLRRRQYRPGVDISSALLKEATAEHRKMASAFRKWEGDRVKGSHARIEMAGGASVTSGPTLSMEKRLHTVPRTGKRWVGMNPCAPSSCQYCLW